MGWSWQNGLTRARWMVTVSQLTRALTFLPETTKSAVRHWCRCVDSFSHHRPSQARPHRPQCPSNCAFTRKDIASVLRRRPRNHPWLVFDAWIASLVQSLLALPHARKGLAANRSTGLENARIAGSASWWSRTAPPTWCRGATIRSLFLEIGGFVSPKDRNVSSRLNVFVSSPKDRDDRNVSSSAGCNVSSRLQRIAGDVIGSPCGPLLF